MRTGQLWVFLEIGLGVVFIVTMFCLCRYFDVRKSKRRKGKAKAADEDLFQRQLSQQRERALSIRRESLIAEAAGSEAKQPLTGGSASGDRQPLPEEAEEPAASASGEKAAEA